MTYEEAFFDELEKVGISMGDVAAFAIPTAVGAGGGALMGLRAAKQLEKKHANPTPFQRYVRRQRGLPEVKPGISRLKAGLLGAGAGAVGGLGMGAAIHSMRG